MQLLPETETIAAQLYGPLTIEGTRRQPSYNDVIGKIEVLNRRLRTLQHHHDTTVGLWATDRPDKVTAPDDLLFEIKPVT